MLVTIGWNKKEVVFLYSIVIEAVETKSKDSTLSRKHRRALASHMD